jgi:hypothetical protein
LEHGLAELNETFPEIRTNMKPDEVGDTLRKMSKRGKLAGYQASDRVGSAVADAHGTPFDSDLLITWGTQDDETQVSFGISMRRKMPIVFALILVITIWPGLPLTDSFMQSFGWYERLMGESIETWMWYLPMTVLPAPFVWRTSIMKSKASAYQHALETVEKIRVALGS